MIRLSTEELINIPLEHLMTIIDDDQFSTSDSNVPIASGISEWVARDPQGRQVSIGFDWTISNTPQKTEIQLYGKPRHNMQVIDKKGKELEFEIFCLKHLLKKTDWKQPILQQLGSHTLTHCH